MRAWRERRGVTSLLLLQALTGFIPRVPLDLSKETRGEEVIFSRRLSRVGNGRNKLAQRCGKNVTSERPIALVLALIRWCPCLRALQVSRWQEKHRVGWDATDGRTRWTDLITVQLQWTRERSRWRLLWQKEFELVRRPASVGLGDAVQFSQEDFASAMRLFRAPAAGTVRWGALRRGSWPSFSSSLGQDGAVCSFT